MVQDHISPRLIKITRSMSIQIHETSKQLTSSTSNKIAIICIDMTTLACPINMKNDCVENYFLCSIFESFVGPLISRPCFDPLSNLSNLEFEMEKKNAEFIFGFNDSATFGFIIKQPEPGPRADKSNSGWQKRDGRPKNVSMEANRMEHYLHGACKFVWSAWRGRTYA